MMSSDRLDWVDQVKGIAILLVLLGHCLFIPVIREGNLLMNFISGFHVPVFFIVSGLFFSPAKNSLKKTFIKLIVPYFFFIGIGAAAFALCGHFKCGAGWRDCVLSVFNGCPYYNGTLWFLIALASSKLLFPVALRGGGGLTLPLLAVCAYAFQFGPGWIRTDIPFRPSVIPMSLFFFSTGYFARKGILLACSKKKNALYDGSLFLACFVLGGGLAVLCGKTGFASVNYGHRYWALLYPIRAILGFVMIMATIRLLREMAVIRSALSFLGRHSIVFFGLNLPVSVICIHYMCGGSFTSGFWLNQHQEPIAVALAVLSVNIILSSLLVKPIEVSLSFCQKFVGNLIGDL